MLVILFEIFNLRDSDLWETVRQKEKLNESNLT